MTVETEQREDFSGIAAGMNNRGSTSAHNRGLNRGLFEGENYVV